MAYAGARVDEAGAHFERAIELFETVGDRHQAARVSSRLAEISWDRGRLEQGLEAMDTAYTLLAEEEPDANLAALAAQVGRFMFFSGQPDRALERLERALEIAEALDLPETLAQALNSKGIALESKGRKVEGVTLIRKALEIALDNDKPSAALRAYFNLADGLLKLDRSREAADLVRTGLAFARRVGNRYWEWSFLGYSYPLFVLGDWDEVLEWEALLPSEDWERVRIAFFSLLVASAPIRVHRGLLDDARAQVRMFASAEKSADVQEQAQFGYVHALLAFAEGRYEDALRQAHESLELTGALGVDFEAMKELMAIALDAAFALGDLETVERLVATVDAAPPGVVTQFHRAHVQRSRARLAALRRDAEEADRLFRRTTALFRELESPFHLAVALLEHGELLRAEQRAAEAEQLLAEAREIFERLGATPWLERARTEAAALAEASL
jgi:tetratricopeptide (TPR) repeat protein